MCLSLYANLQHLSVSEQKASAALPEGIRSDQGVKLKYLNVVFFCRILRLRRQTRRIRTAHPCRLPASAFGHWSRKKSSKSESQIRLCRPPRPRRISPPQPQQPPQQLLRKTVSAKPTWCGCTFSVKSRVHFFNPVGIGSFARKSGGESWNTSNQYIRLPLDQCTLNYQVWSKFMNSLNIFFYKISRFKFVHQGINEIYIGLIFMLLI